MSTRIFITGATGYVGSAIAARFARGGYDVYGLTRNPERAADLTARSIHPVVGNAVQARHISRCTQEL